MKKVLLVLSACLTFIALTSILVSCDPEPKGGSSAPFTVMFHTGDGSGIPPNYMRVVAGTIIRLPGLETMVPPAGKELSGWRAGGTNYNVGANYTVRGDVDFIAQWRDSTGSPGGNTPTLPSAPTGVTATALSDTSIRISWSMVTGAASYKLYYGSAGDSNPTSFRSLSETATSYEDTGKSAGSTYYYKVSAINSVGEGPASTIVSATTSQPPIPGSSSTYAITLASSTSISSGSFPQGLDAVWYTFSTSANARFNIYDKAYSGNTSYTADICIDFYDSSLSYMIFSDTKAPIRDFDMGNNSVADISVSAAGRYYIVVKPKYNSSSNKGTLGIYYRNY